MYFVKQFYLFKIANNNKKNYIKLFLVRLVFEFSLSKRAYNECEVTNRDFKGGCFIIFKKTSRSLTGCINTRKIIEYRIFYM